VTTTCLYAQNSFAADFEKPARTAVRALPGIAARGANYTILGPVPSDGFLRNYTVNTSYGPMRVDGGEFLKLRLKELRALDALDRTTGSQQFANAVVNAGLKPVEFTATFIQRPLKTVGNTISGVGAFFSGVISGVRNAGQSQENVLESVSGAARQKRLIAFQYGVDPYTEYNPLADRLEKLSVAAAVGGLAVTGAFIAIPGAAGTIIANVSTAQTLNNMVRDYSSAQLMDVNRKKLAALGVSSALTESFLTNRAYTPVDTTAMVDALERMRPMRGFDIMVERADLANGRDIAYFIRKRIEMTAAYQERTRRLTGFIRFGNSAFPLAATSDNGIVGIFPIDILSWTASSAKIATTLTSDIQSAGISGPKLLRITGTTTSLARKNLAQLGWTIEERARD
jgi:hypothetical protein